MRYSPWSRVRQLKEAVSGTKTLSYTVDCCSWLAALSP